MFEWTVLGEPTNLAGCGTIPRRRRAHWCTIFFLLLLLCACRRRPQPSAVNANRPSGVKHRPQTERPRPRQARVTRPCLAGKSNRRTATKFVPNVPDAQTNGPANVLRPHRFAPVRQHRWRAPSCRNSRPADVLESGGRLSRSGPDLHAQCLLPSASISRRTLLARSSDPKSPASFSETGEVRPSRKWSGRQVLEGLVVLDSARRGRFRGRSERREPIGRFTPSVLVVSWASVAKAANCECPLLGLPAGARGR